MTKRRRKTSPAQREAAAHRKWKQRLLEEAGAFEVKIVVSAEVQDALAEAGFLQDYEKEAVEDAIYKLLEGLVPVSVTP